MSLHKLQLRDIRYRDGRRRFEARCGYDQRSWPCPEAQFVLGPQESRRQWALARKLEKDKEREAR